MYPSALVITLDIAAKNHPDILMDIKRWQIKNAFSKGFFDIIWASPPCTEYSPAMTRKPRDISDANNIVRAILKSIEDAQPRTWFLENPHTMLYKQTFMTPYEHLRHTCTHCKYRGRVKKPTDIYTNVKLPRLKHCDDEPCTERKRTGGHSKTAQQGYSGEKRNIPGTNAKKANKIPARLLRVLIDAAKNHITSVANERITWE